VRTLPPARGPRPGEIEPQAPAAVEPTADVVVPAEPEPEPAPHIVPATPVAAEEAPTPAAPPAKTVTSPSAPAEPKVSPPTATPPMTRRAHRPGFRPLGSGSVTARPNPTPSLRDKLMGKVAESKPKENVIAPKTKLTDDQMRIISTAQHKSDVQKAIQTQPGP